MLSINPMLWGFASYSCIIKFPSNNIIRGVLLNSLLFTFEAIITDLIFFGLIRNAMDKLMQPTTFYSWGFVICFPFFIYFLFRKLIDKNKNQLTLADFKIPLAVGLLAFASICIIVAFKIRFA